MSSADGPGGPDGGQGQGLGDPERFAELPETTFHFQSQGAPVTELGRHTTRTYAYMFDIFEFIDVFEESGIDAVGFAAGDQPLTVNAAQFEAEFMAILRVLENRPREIVLHPEWREATIGEFKALREFVSKGARRGYDLVIEPGQRVAGKKPSYQ